ncbi:cation transporter [Cohnella herbarum]|uniref:Heavy-metal-associated domain-containing protein n=1 Tax=Cohnella herbarum TaxID=2728023 RepID=A0A7Z2ZKE9_9BACL|nr:cation transporter [Cohnella herbarum]QJD82760.1 heavy-metal-associated domain-containing protein [Cohnella herbarum]
MKNVLLNVEGMTCGHCVRTIEGAVQALDAKATVDLDAGLVEVVYDDSNISLDAIVETIEEQGYDVLK